jgi:hypothetical protein
MITLTTLPLAGGQRGDGRSDWPEAGEHAPTFAKMSEEDEGLTTEHEDLFDVDVMLKLLSILIMHLKHNCIYNCILKLIFHAARGESSDSEDLYFCKSWSVGSSTKAVHLYISIILWKGTLRDLENKIIYDESLLMRKTSGRHFENKIGKIENKEDG